MPCKCARVRTRVVAGKELAPWRQRVAHAAWRLWPAGLGKHPEPFLLASPFPPSLPLPPFLPCPFLLFFIPRVELSPFLSPPFADSGPLALPSQGGPSRRPRALSLTPPLGSRPLAPSPS